MIREQYAGYVEMRIAVIQRANANNVQVLSGIPYFAMRALEKHVGEVVFMGPDESLLTRAIEICGRAANRLLYLLFKRRISADHNRILAVRLARVFARRLEASACDVIFAPNASVEIAHLATKIPIVYYSDLNWADIVDYYPESKSLFGFARGEGDEIDARAVSKASALIYPSPWAMRTAIEHYHADPSRVHYIPCGANFDKADIPPFDVAIQHPLNSRVKLLWIGVDWVRKGGNIAFDCLLELERRGVNAHLVVCGCIPPEKYRHPKMEVIPFLNKNDSEQRQRLSKIFLDASFFLFPTVAEAYGIVLCEASAHGLPSLVRNTGGVGGAVTDEKNGYLMPPDAEGVEYAEKIVELIQDPAAYCSLVKASRVAYDERLNWDAWGHAVRPIFEQVFRSPMQRPWP